MHRKLLVGIGAVLGLLMGAAVSQAAGPQFSQVTNINMFGSGANASTFAQYYAKGSLGGPSFFGTNFAGPTTILQFANSSGGTLYPFTVKVAAATATYQQVFLTSRGSLFTTNAGTGTLTPIKLEIFITLTLKPAPAVYGGGKLATLTFKALDPKGQTIFASGPLTGSWK